MMGRWIDDQELAPVFGNEVARLRVLGLDTSCSPAINPTAQKLFQGPSY